MNGSGRENGSSFTPIFCLTLARMCKVASTRLAAHQMVYEQTITYTKNLKKVGQVLYLLINTNEMPDEKTLTCHIEALTLERNTKLATVDWQFTCEDARLYPSYSQ